MSIANLVLPRLVEWEPSHPGRHALTCGDGEWDVTLVVDRRDEFSCLTWELRLRRSGEPLTADLADRADRLAAITTGLLEPLRVVEVDPVGQEFLLRSKEPSARGEVLAYYEARVAARGDATFQRFQTGRHLRGRREQTAFALTHEALANLVGSLCQP